MDGKIELQLYLNDEGLRALGQFIKRVSWAEYRSCAVDDSEAYQIRHAVEELYTALVLAGFRPR